MFDSVKLTEEIPLTDEGTAIASICRVRRHRQSPKKERQSDSDAPYTRAKETSIGFVYTIP